MSSDSADRDCDLAVWSREEIEYLIHDLQNPVSTVLINLHLLEQQGYPPPGLGLVREAMAAMRRLQRMIQNLLDAGRLQAGQLALERITVPLEDLVEEGVAAVRTGAAAAGVPLAVDLGPQGDVLVEVDFDLMTRVLVNLLENAIRYGPRDTPVEVGAEGEGPWLRLVVTDRGPGVPEAQREHIFRRFVRRSSEGSQRGGAGLGLAFARLVAEAHGVPIGVEPAQPRGSRFFVGMAPASGEP